MFVSSDMLPFDSVVMMNRSFKRVTRAPSPATGPAGAMFLRLTFDDYVLLAYLS